MVYFPLVAPHENLINIIYSEKMFRQHHYGSVITTIQSWYIPLYKSEVLLFVTNIVRLKHVWNPGHRQQQNSHLASKLKKMRTFVFVFVFLGTFHGTN